DRSLARHHGTHRARGVEGARGRALLHAPQARDEVPARDPRPAHAVPSVLRGGAHAGSDLAQRLAMRQIAVAALLLVPRVALACPACLSNSRLSTALEMVGVFMTIPFILCGVIIWAIRRAQRLEQSSPLVE